jgi:hypothetical protein
MEEYYRVTLKTANDWYGGTDSRILVQLIDAGDASIYCATDDAFWAGTTQTISLNSDTVINQSGWTQADFEKFGDPTYIMLSNEGGDEWHPEWVTVEEMDHEQRPHAVWGAHFAGSSTLIFFSRMTSPCPTSSPRVPSRQRT